MSAFTQDLRHAMRALRAGGGVTLIAVVTLALGIGANTAIFSVANGILLEPLPYDRPAELVLLGERHGSRPVSVAWLNYADWKAENRTFADMGATQGFFLNLTQVEAEPERLRGARVTASYFSTLGVPPLIGRVFSAREDGAGGEAVVLLAEAAWHRLFGGDPAVIGRTLTLNDTPHTVIGVMPSSFSVDNPPVDAWVSLGRVADLLGNRGNHAGITVVGRLRPGVALDAARADLEAIAARLAQEYPATNRDIGVVADPLHQKLVGADLSRALLVLLGAVAFVLLIACANVANLLLSRGAARSREIAVRAALGAGRARLVRQMLTESVVLAVAGGTTGILLAVSGLRALLAVVPDNIARINAVRIDAPVLAFTLALTALAGIVFGIVPALQISRPDLVDALKEGGRIGTAGRRAHRTRAALVVGQVALSLVLLVGAGLMLRSFAALHAASPGLVTTDVVAASVTLPAARYRDEERRRQVVAHAIDRLSSTPGIAAAAAITPLPLSGFGWQTSFAVEGRPEPEPGKYPTNDIARITPDYFRTMGIRLLRGRTFTWQDDGSAPPVAIIDETFARTWFAGQDAIGQRIKINAGHPPPGGPPPAWSTVVGVVNHVKNYGLDAESRVEVYVPYMQSTVTTLNLVARGRAGTAALGQAMRRSVGEADPALPVFSIRSMDEYLARTMTPKRLLMVVLASFAAIALTLAAVGIYGVMSYTVAQRAPEIGIRIALGAHPRRVLGRVVGHGMALTAAGICAGLVGAYWLTGLLARLLFGVTTTDPATFAGVAGLLAVVALLATWLPARRAARVDPLVALRCQ